MLVMTLRTVTFIALWRWTSSRTIWSVLVSCGGQPVVQPAQRRRRVGIAVAQALGELHGERRRPRRLRPGAAGSRRRLGIVRSRAQNPVGERCRPAGLRDSRATIASARRRRFSTSVMRKVIAIAHNSPMVSGCTR